MNGMWNGAVLMSVHDHVAANTQLQRRDLRPRNRARSSDSPAAASRQAVKTTVVAVVGFVLTCAGIALLVLPGPGLVLVTIGLATLATQFEWADAILDRARDRANADLDQVANNRLRALFYALFALALTVTGALEIAGIDLPLVNFLTAVMLICSGVFLLGTVVYARASDRRGDQRG
jgi:uncharacterized protein (TIGR02611 family)